MRGAVEAGDVFGCMVQYPDADGEVEDLTGFVATWRSAKFGPFLRPTMALLVLKSPGAMGADVWWVVLNVLEADGMEGRMPLAAREGFKRHFPGRIIGVSVDRLGQPALRMALQTREQHIRRDKATSNLHRPKFVGGHGVDVCRITDRRVCVPSLNVCTHPYLSRPWGRQII